MKLGLGACASAGLSAAPALSWANPFNSNDIRTVALHNLHTGEMLEAVYFEQGDYIPDVLEAVNHQLRDYRNGKVHPINPGVLDLLHAVSERTESRATFQVISGYRSPETNAMLHEHSGEVAKRSLHVQGMAIDVRLPGVELRHLHAAALSLGRGGVGYYPGSDFVHMDVGPVRSWSGT
ncbi:DUF882 domain-containing protein [Phenylobacterium montanum]|uniref:DUF882 domain-containing protein n=1 Tax=Phenylobacterium montanum TaxID=2823693 RepID=UPI002013B365|nr:DUF882 domain-containing protein [Caulobacter sp. S6]